MRSSYFWRILRFDLDPDIDREIIATSTPDQAVSADFNLIPAVSRVVQLSCIHLGQERVEQAVHHRAVTFPACLMRHIQYLSLQFDIMIISRLHIWHRTMT
jgi:hypothetical protein